MVVVGINEVVVIMGSVYVGIIGGVGVVLRILGLLLMICWKQRTFSYKGVSLEQLEPEHVRWRYLNPFGEQSEHAVQGDHSVRLALN